MKAVVLRFPGINRENDAARALKAAGFETSFVWHTETTLPNCDLVMVPGGFSYGDYLRCGAIAARAAIIGDLKKKSEAGLPVIGVCNGFQILIEAGLLPGALLRNAQLTFVSREVSLKVENNATRFSSSYTKGQVFNTPVAHHDGNYFADSETLKTLHGEGRIVFSYANGTNPNGSVDDIAGIINASGNILGMMPHPENYVEAALGGTDGLGIFQSLAASVMEAA
jgi:phosphoribosylformylglycinamidine synthase